MSISSTWVEQVRVGSENYVSFTDTLTNDAAMIVEDFLPGQTTGLVAITPFNTAKTSGMYLACESGNMTLRFVGATPINVALVAGVPFSWRQDTGITNPLASVLACTGCSGLVTGTAPVALHARIVYDA